MTSRVAQIRKSVLTLALPVTVSSLLRRSEGPSRCLPRRWSRRHIHRSRRTWPVAGLHSHHARLRIIGGRKRPHRPTVGRSPHQRCGRSRHASPRIGSHRVLFARGTRIVPESCHHGPVGRGERRHQTGPSLFELHLPGHSLHDILAGPFIDYARHRRHQDSDVRLDRSESTVFEQSPTRWSTDSGASLPGALPEQPLLRVSQKERAWPTSSGPAESSLGHHSTYDMISCAPPGRSEHRFPVNGYFNRRGIIVYTKIVLVYGTVTYAAHQVGLSIESLSFLPGYGFAIAAATMVGRSLGAGKYVRAKLENWEANRLATVAMASMGVLFFFFPYALLRAFTNDEAVVELGTVFLRIVAILQVPLALTMVLAGSLRGAGDTRFIMFATTIGMWGIRLPLAVIAGPWLALDVLYVWSAMIADWTVRMALLLWRYRSERWKAIQVIR